MTEVNGTIKGMENELRRIRRELHKIPELGLKEYKTSAYIEKQLKAIGVDVVERWIGTAVIGLIKGQGKKEAIAFRADMDALPVTEPPKDYASLHEGVMHACGHDGHMTILLGFARYITAQKMPPEGDILLIFQPAEEGPGGAELLIRAGLFEKYKVSKIIGCHLFPQVPEGMIACKSGAMMARNGEVTVRIRGTSAHGAQPHLGNDAVLAAGAVITGLHTIISRNISPLDSGVLTFGSVHGGETMNIIASEVVLEGTMRAFSDNAYETMARRIRESVEGIAAGYGCKGDAEFRHMYRVVDNDPDMVKALEESCSEHYTETEPYMLAEDFSMYMQRLPGLFFFLGTGNEEKGFTHSLHSAEFDFDERVLCIGVEVYVNILNKLYEK